MRSLTARPISSAKARRVLEAGRDLANWSMSMSMHRTNSVGDMGHPCLTPGWRVMEGKS